MKKLIYFCLFFISLNTLSQSQDKYPLLAQGETPTFLAAYKTRYFIPEKEPWIRGIKNDHKQFYLDILYSSNAIVFGDNVSAYCNELLSNFSDSAPNVYLVRSDKVATFSDDENLFITVGLISRLSNEAQLMFHLVRELEIFRDGQIQQFKDGLKKRSLDFAVMQLSNFEHDFNSKMDERALSLISAKNLYTKGELQSVLNPLKYQNRPFYEYSFDISYFNSDKSYIPESDYFLLRKAKPKKYDYRNEFPDLKKRVGNIGKPSASITQKTFLLNKDRFLKIVTTCRYESIRLNLLHANFISAIYEIYILEQLGLSSRELDIMKASAWWGVVNQSVGNIDPKKYTRYESSDSEGALFMLYLKTKSKLAKISMALRITQDIRQLHPESQSVERMFHDLIEIASKMEDFELSNFHDAGLKETIKKYNEDPRSEKNALLNVESQVLESEGIDSINYYYFLIPDLVKDEKFNATYNAYKNNSVQKSDVKVNGLSLVDFDIRKYKHKKIKKLKSAPKTVSKSIELVQNKTGIQTDTAEITQETAYNLSYLMNALIMQNYWYNNYKEPFHAVFSDDFVNLSNHIQTDLLGSFVYEHAYEPRYKPFHLLGLAVVTLPYIIPEIFFSGNRTIASSVIIDSKTGETIQLTNRRYRDPYSSLMVQQAFLDEITRLSYD